MGLSAVCDTETRGFNEEAKRLSSDVVFLTMSMELPFVQNSGVVQEEMLYV